MNDVETIQRARGWRESVRPFLPDPLADNPEDWWEFGQIIKWAEAKGWAFVLELAAHHYCAEVNSAVGWMGNGYGDFRAATIAALAAAVRNESEVEG